MRPIVFGICGAFFFAFTFVLNRSMEISGGSWIWSASLRYFWTVLFLLIIVLGRKQLRHLLAVMREAPLKWLWWSFVGFGLFYAPMCFSAAYAPGWLVAATFQITIVFGSLLAPLFYENVETANGTKKVRGKIPLRGLGFSLVILAGIILMQMEHAKEITLKELLLGALPMLISAVAYPLGNRKMMEVSGGKLHTFERVLGMTIASLPFWLLLAVFGLFTEGVPSSSQTIQSGMVALFAGVIATVLFFRATDLVRGQMTKLAAVEATQSVAVLFALLGELFLLSAAVPSPLSWAGMLMVILGMVLHSFASRRKVEKSLTLSKKVESLR
ncbi:DMT family transporter [Bacillus tuaregi]|uniref:DMT family transporter n=1 Tax=Bacillus tuaregi TaxID=1816695 RepID=UPI0008F8160A|nr:multidrug resistance efflux transporter family protein [Bacillus tuaregi]